MDIQEKRNYIRRFTAMNIDCYSADGARPLDTCVLINISKGGIAVESKKKFMPGEKLMVRFTSPEGKQHHILTEILYCESGTFGNIYGAKYCETNINTMIAFNRYLLKYFNLY